MSESIAGASYAALFVGQAEDLILERLQGDVYDCWLEETVYDLHRYIAAAPLSELFSSDYEIVMQERAKVAVERQPAKAERFLRKVVKSDILADMLHGSVDIDEYVNARIQSVIHSA